MPVYRVLAGHLLFVLHVTLTANHECCRFSFLPALYAISPPNARSLLLHSRAHSSHYCTCPTMHAMQLSQQRVLEVAGRMRWEALPGRRSKRTLNDDPATGLMVRMKRFGGPWNMEMHPRLSLLPSCSMTADESKVSCISAAVLLSSCKPCRAQSSVVHTWAPAMMH